MSKLKRPSAENELAMRKKNDERREESRKLGNRNKHRGKGYQTTLAKMVQGANIGTLGGEDVSHDWFSFEAKTRKTFAGETIMRQAEVNNPSAKKVPVAVIHIIGEKYENDLVMMRFKDWSKLSVEE